uniref:HTH CENPB-type domain-containing protein n=1 Tax=Scleropages formosus TaxID=113540 RepID=A0A8C9SKK2_SCLFO
MIMTGKRHTDAKITQPKRKRTKIDLEMKMKMIKKYEGGQNLSAIARELGLSVSTVNTIVKNAARIKEHVKGCAPLKSTIITKQRSGAIYEMEKLLMMWMEDQIRKCVPLSLMNIQAKARSLYEDIKGKYPTACQSFVASNGWFHRFKNRVGLHNKVSGDAASGDVAATESFSAMLKEIIKEGGYLQQQIFNVDETGLFWKKMPSQTCISEEEKEMSGFKAGKDRLTLLLGCNASGCCKVKPLLVYHSENPRALKGISKATLPVYYRSNPKASVTVAIFEDWFFNCFIPEVEKYCREKGIPFKILLILDNAPGHPAHLDDFHPNVKVVFLPSNNNTLLIQPMEQGVMANFKAYYLRATFAQAAAALDRDPNQMVRDFWKSYSLYHGILNIAKAWQALSQNCCISAWKSLCPQFACCFNGFEKDETCEEVAEKILKLAEQLELDVDGNDLEEWIESHGQELTSEDLLELEATKVAEIQAEASKEPEEEPKRFITKEMSTAFLEIASGMARLEKMDPNASRFFKVQRGVDESLACYREIYENKRKTADRSSNFIRKTECTSQPAISQPSTSHKTCTASAVQVEVYLEDDHKGGDIARSHISSSSSI